MASDFIIDSMAWYKGRTLNQDIALRFKEFARFLQTNALSTRTLLDLEQPVPDGFEIKSTDVTAEGLAVIRAVYTKWTKSIDRGKSPTDVKVLEKGLAEIRASEQSA